MAAISEHEKEGLEKARELVEKKFHTHYTIDYLAEVALMSRSKLIRLYRSYYGMALFEHLHACRMAHGKKMLEDSAYSIKMIAYKCGYKHSCNFSTAFKKKYGLSPLAYRTS